MALKLNVGKIRGMAMRFLGLLSVDYLVCL